MNKCLPVASSFTRRMPAVSGGSSGVTRPWNVSIGTSSFGLVRYQKVIGDGHAVRMPSHQSFGPVRSAHRK